MKGGGGGGAAWGRNDRGAFYNSLFFGVYSWFLFADTSRFLILFFASSHLRIVNLAIFAHDS